ncbi:hypothetical protein RIEPE_0289 [Candidatus Riesia pediculicola USDA]|uniref:Uncharacterized protein n=1 Tax=Riesia pediculicola (strain USDA) TaxID=515618 RepID=D4G884_RIEPU|nr:hypothetical protein RIEPE_0289 [Candidatus Riesia pediculicola USDA]ARC53782.1 hypothetical protein AOE55_01290 [Candidatus Riesia pediculicola]ARC54535.1 hypothetical protein AOE56_01440 [Candidatus Riesia pediculicola]
MNSILPKKIIFSKILIFPRKKTVLNGLLFDIKNTDQQISQSENKYTIKKSFWKNFGKKQFPYS